MLALTNMVHFFTYKFACLGAWRFSLLGVFVGSFDDFRLRHIQAPQVQYLFRTQTALDR
jgi:hypothetical protein